MTKISTVCAILVFFFACMIGLNPKQHVVEGFLGDILYATGPLEIVVSVAMLAIGIFFGWLVILCYEKREEFLGGIALQVATFCIALGGWRCLADYQGYLEWARHASGN